MERILFTELTSNEQETLQGGSGFATYGSPVNNVQGGSTSNSSASASQAQGQQQQGQALTQTLQNLTKGILG